METPKAMSIFPKEIQDARLNYQQKAFLYCLPKTGFNMSKTCKILDIPYSKAKSWVNDDAVFAEMVADMKDERLDLAESILLENMQHKNRFVSNAAVMFFLKTQGKSRGYIEKPTTNILINNEASRSKEERDAIIDAAVITQDAEFRVSNPQQLPAPTREYDEEE